tara:strand:- start:228 stop:566 length:339 start_codon:yes stop_codon:yes gene_type:complete
LYIIFLILIISNLVIYFSIGLIYLLLHFIFSDFKHSAKRCLILFLSFVLLWPILLFNPIRLCFTIGKYLTFEGRWQLFFPARETKKEESDNNFVSSEMSDFFDEANNNQAPF